MALPSNPRGFSIEHAFGSAATENVRNASCLSVLSDSLPSLTVRPSDVDVSKFVIDLPYLRTLCSLLEHNWTWETLAAKLNRFNHYTVELGEGENAFTLHYMLEKSEKKDATPLLMLHGWPGSVYDFHKVIPTLVNPPDGQQAFHVVVPSLPGFFLSSLPKHKGWKFEDTAKALNDFMKSVLKYPKYGVHAGGLSQYIARILGANYNENVTLVHISFATPPTSYDKSKDRNVSGYETNGLDRWSKFQETCNGHLGLQYTKPPSIGFAIGASPISLLAYIGERFHPWSDPDGLDDWDIVHTTAMYFLSRSFAKPALHLQDNSDMMLKMQDNPANNFQVKCFFGYSHYKYDFSVCPKTRLPEYTSYTDKDNKKVYYSNEHDKGGHFPALDAPDEFVGDLRECFDEKKKAEPKAAEASKTAG